MKILERTALILFSTIVLILSIIMALLIFNWMNISIIDSTLELIISNSAISNVLLGICTVLILLAIKCIFFDNSGYDEYNANNGIFLKNENGKLLISKDTIENLASSVVKNFEGVENATTKAIIDKEGRTKINVVIYVHQDAILKELSNNIQLKIKETIQKTLDVELNEVNINVKNVATKKVSSQE